MVNQEGHKNHQKASYEGNPLIGNPPNLIAESLYLQGARDMLMMLAERGKIDFGWYNIDRCKLKEEKGSRAIYNKCILGFLLGDRENIRRFLQGDLMACYDHQRDKQGKFISVKVKFDKL